MKHYALGLDFGTNSVRAIVVDTSNGDIRGSHVCGYAHGDMGVIGSDRDPNVSRQHPADYIAGIETTVVNALKEAAVAPAAIAGIGVDATASTPIPVDASGEALALQSEFENNAAAMAWLWKDHTSVTEAREITEKARELRPEYLAKCGGTYSSEWFWSKLLHCARSAPEVFEAAYTWVELPDWVPALLTGTTSPALLKRCLCAAGHKGLYSPEWNGYAAAEFLHAVDPCLARIRATLPDRAYHIGGVAGTLCEEWANRLGLPAGIPVAVGTIDAHAGAVGSGVCPGVMVKIIGTSTCDIAVSPLSEKLPDIPGICGVAHESVLPGCYGLEAGQSAVGDIFNWFVHKMEPGGGVLHRDLDEQAALLKPGESGLLALDWHNGNRSTLTDPELTGAMLGFTLQTTPAEVFRAWVEATAFGARVIIERYREFGVPVDRVINCGGISVKSPMTMQIYADVLGCPMEVSANEQSCALGAAMAGAVVGGAHPDFPSAADAMTGVAENVYLPVAKNQNTYDQMFGLYTRLHDLFGTRDYAENQFHLMKELIRIRKASRNGDGAGAPQRQ
jgi:L-ribulokinase